MYPLRFQPIFRRYLWGGRRLETVLGKTLGDGDDYAESWEIVDHGDDQSVVTNGSLIGKTLRELVESHGKELFGRHYPLKTFPLLFKFLDAHRNLSVQVHPDDSSAAKLVPPDLGKTEAWVILHAEPGSLVYAGLKRGFDRAALEREVNRGTTELCLHRFKPQVGDCISIPAGTVHALGEGLVVAEIQQASDTTFRLFDWNRVASNGKPRPLHIEQALQTINYDYGPVEPQVSQSSHNKSVERLVSCDKFNLDRWRLRAAESIGGDDRFHILTVLDGKVRMANDPSREAICKGQTVLVPASAGLVSIQSASDSVLLDAYLP